MHIKLVSLTFAVALAAGIAAPHSPAHAQLATVWGKKWAAACLSSERTKTFYKDHIKDGDSAAVLISIQACCGRQKVAEDACKNVANDLAGRKNCQGGEDVCKMTIKDDSNVKNDMANADKIKADKAKKK
jgi:hypothetical protein